MPKDSTGLNIVTNSGFDDTYVDSDGAECDSPTILTIKLHQMRAKAGELESQLKKYRKSSYKMKKNNPGANYLYMPLPILNMVPEEIIVLEQHGNIFDEAKVKQSLLMGFATSRQVRDDALLKIRKSIESLTGRKINIFSYE